MCKLRIIGNLYYNMPPSEDFYSRMDFTNANHPIERGLYHVTDLDLWFESDFEEGCLYVVRRVSRNAKYNFNKVWMDW